MRKLEPDECPTWCDRDEPTVHVGTWTHIRDLPGRGAFAATIFQRDPKDPEHVSGTSCDVQAELAYAGDIIETSLTAADCRTLGGIGAQAADLLDRTAPNGADRATDEIRGQLAAASIEIHGDLAASDYRDLSAIAEEAASMLASIRQ